MPLRIATSPSSFRVRLLYHLEKVVILVVLLPERVGGESMLFCPMGPAVVFGHDVGKLVEYLLVRNRFPIRSETRHAVQLSAAPVKMQADKLTGTARSQYT